MEYKQFKFELKAVDEEGTFSGYASTFGPPADSYGDIIEEGAFKRTLAHRKGKVALLDMHDPRRRAGVVYLEEDAKGLKVSKGVLNRASEVGAALHSDLLFYQQHGLPMEMSIGFDAVKRDLADGVRHLKEIKLWEVSLVTPAFAANPRAGVAGAKAVEDGRGLEERIAALESQAAALLDAIGVLDPAGCKDAGDSLDNGLPGDGDAKALEPLAGLASEMMRWAREH